jgi:hypothetical protein
VKPSKHFRKILGFLMGVLMGAAISYLGLMLIGPKSGISHPWYVKLALIPIAIAALWFAIAFHELGHVLAGLSQKFKFRLIAVGPLMLEQELGRLKFKRNTNFNTYGGLALCLPTDDRQLGRRFAIFAAGGPIASLLLSVLLLFGLIWIQLDTTTPLLFLLESGLFLICLISFGIGILTSIPMQADGFTSDGGRIWNLLKGGPAAQIEMALLHAVAQGSAGIRPALIDPEPLLTALEYSVNSPYKTYLNAILYNHYQDRGDLENAGSFLEAYLSGAETVPKGYLAIISLEKAWFEARYHRNPDEAKAYFFREKIGVMVPKSQVLRAEAAIAFAEENYSLAAYKAHAAIAELPKLMDQGAAIAEKEWLQTLLSACSNK